MTNVTAKQQSRCLRCYIGTWPNGVATWVRRQAQAPPSVILLVSFLC